MRKVNKIMLITVSMLLSLVLITSSVVSTTFAKYATTGQSSTSARVAKWGVTVTLTPNTAQLKTVNDNHGNQTAFTATLDSAGTNATYEIKNLKLAPGDNLDKIAHFTVSGNAEVPLRVNIIVHIDFVESDFKITTITGNNNLDTEAELKQVYPNIDSAINKCLFPIRFGMYLKKADNSEEYVAISNPFRKNIKTGNEAEGTCANIFVQKLDVVKDTTSADACVYKDFLTPGTSISFVRVDNKSVIINDFYLGFDYPMTASRPSDDPLLTEAAVNAVSTYLSQNKPNATFDVRFTVSVEQIVT